MLLAVLFVLAAEKNAKEEEEPSSRITPVQADVSVHTGIADRPVLAGALYFGGAMGWAVEHKPSFFAGLGVEVTYAAFADPYRISMGGQLRLGLVWATHRGYTSDLSPDLLVYARLTPFGAGLSDQKTMGGMTVTTSSTMFGFRAGLGLTSTWLPRLYFDRFPFFDVDGVWGDVLKVLTTILLFPVAMLNHGEVAFEYVFSPSPLAALLFRFGTGF